MGVYKINFAQNDLRIMLFIARYFISVGPKVFRMLWFSYVSSTVLGQRSAPNSNVGLYMVL